LKANYDHVIKQKTIQSTGGKAQQLSIGYINVYKKVGKPYNTAYARHVNLP